MQQILAHPRLEPRDRSFQLTAPHRIAVIGCGTMGRAISLGGLRSSVIAAERLVFTSRSESTAAAIAHEVGAAFASDNVSACAQSDLVILCVKPKDIPEVLDELAGARALEHRPLLISIAAGVTTATVEARIGNAAPVVRAMPNTPCRIGRGMTVICKGTLATDEHLAIATEIFASLGRCLTLEEKHLDVVTAVSASGPAFIYLVIEALSDGGVMCGLSRDAACELVAQMTLGAAAMVLETGTHPSVLKDDVTTPAGCTIAGLLALEDGGVRSTFARAIETTTRVAAGLGK